MIFLFDDVLMIRCVDEVSQSQTIRDNICKKFFVYMADLMISDNNIFSFSANVTRNNNSPKHPLTILQGERCFRKFAFYYVALHLADSQNMYAELFSHMAENTQVSQNTFSRRAHT